MTVKPEIDPEVDGCIPEVVGQHPGLGIGEHCGVVRQDFACHLLRFVDRVIVADADDE